MRSRGVLAISLALSVVPFLTTTAFGPPPPVAGCPDGFHLHVVGNHHDGQAHFHVGTVADQNGDGWVCAKHVSVDGSVHVHIDNNFPFH